MGGQRAGVAPMTIQVGAFLRSGSSAHIKQQRGRTECQFINHQFSFGGAERCLQRCCQLSFLILGADSIDASERICCCQNDRFSGKGIGRNLTDGLLQDRILGCLLRYSVAESPGTFVNEIGGIAENSADDTRHDRRQDQLWNDVVGKIVLVWIGFPNDFICFHANICERCSARSC